MRNIIMYIFCTAGGKLGYTLTGEWWGILLGGMIAGMIIGIPFEFFMKPKDQKVIGK